MSIYVIIGIFIDDKDLIKLERYETIQREIQKETFDRNSCSHLSDFVYLNKTQKYCSECGIRVRIIPGTPAKYETLKKFIGYEEGFLAPFKAIKKCGSFLCNFCDCTDCDDCEKCEACDKYKCQYKYDREIKITDVFLYERDDECNYGKDDHLPGFILGNNKHKLVNDEFEGFFIPFSTHDLNYIESSLIINSSKITEFENEVGAFLKKFNIQRNLEIRLQDKKKKYYY